MSPIWDWVDCPYPELFAEWSPLYRAPRQRPVFPRSQVMRLGVRLPG